MSALDRRTRTPVVLLWGRSGAFPRPQLVSAFAAGLVEGMPEEHADRRHEAIEWFLDLGDEERRSDWTFWETTVELLVVAPPICATCRRAARGAVEVCECESPVLVERCECGQEGGEHTRYCPSGPAPPDPGPDLDRAAHGLCGWLLDHVDGEAHQELCELHPDTWKEAAEVAIRAGAGERDARPFTTSPDLPR